MALEFLSKLIHLGQRRSHCRIRPESHSARLISSQSRSVSSLFQLVWKLTQSEYDFVEGFREILLFFIKHCSSYCHIHCFRFSVQIVFLYCSCGAKNWRWLWRSCHRASPQARQVAAATGRPLKARVLAPHRSRFVWFSTILNLSLGWVFDFQMFLNFEDVSQRLEDWAGWITIVCVAWSWSVCLFGQVLKPQLR